MPTIIDAFDQTAGAPGIRSWPVPQRDPPGPRRARVLFVIASLDGGGAERVLSINLRHLDRSRFEPGLCLALDVRKYVIPSDVPVWVLLQHVWQVPRFVVGLARLLNSWRPDILCSHLHFVNPLVGLAIGLSAWTGYWFPRFHNDQAKLFFGGARPLYRMLFKKAHKALAVSHGVRRSCVQVFRFSEDKVVAIHNPVDFDRIDSSRDKTLTTGPSIPTVVNVSRLRKHKGHATLLLAFAKMRRNVQARLVILGTGPMRRRLERLAKQLGIDGAVAFKGFVDDPFGLLRRSQAFVLSSTREGLPNSLIEAMACGLPCVSTRCCYGPEEIIEDGKSGLLADVGDSEAMAAAMTRLLTDEPFARRLAEAGNARVRSLFSARRQVSLLERVFVEAIESGARA